MSEKKRNVFIDLLRGISMGAVISLHALANYLHDPFVLKLWDAQQFAVQMFVFCSAYLFFSFPPIVSVASFGGYFLKRFWRLYQPYLIYLVFFFSAVWLIKPASFQWKTVFSSLTLFGGVDISWLVLLFVQFIFVFPLLHFFYTKKHFLFAAAIFIVAYSSIFFFFLPFPYHWRWIMWLTWSFMALYAVFYKRYEDNEHYRDTSYMIFAAVFICVICIEALLKETIAIYPNKYPPNIIVLSYGIVWIGVFDFLHKHGFFEELKLVRPLSFLSANSYSLFFIHYLFIYIMNNALNLNKILPWWGYWLVLFPISIGTQLIINKVWNMFFTKSAK